jgi:prophage regulatory protein
MKLLSYQDLRDRGIRYSRVHLWRLEAAGKFPKRVRLSPARHAWIEDEIDDHLEQLVAAQRDAGGEA